VRLRSHTHNPAFIAQSVKRNLPGMVLIRNPVDAAVSWAIFTGDPVERTLAYYTDFHSAISRYYHRLFLVTFEEVTGDFGAVMRRFNATWGTDYVPFENTPENVAGCIAEIECEYTQPNGQVQEAKVPGPSEARNASKQALLSQINHSPALQKELRRAQHLYHTLLSRPFAPARPQISCANPLRPALAGTSSSSRPIPTSVRTRAL
jgi:hypothetical protein